MSVQTAKRSALARRSPLFQLTASLEPHSPRCCNLFKTHTRNRLSPCLAWQKSCGIGGSQPARVRESVLFQGPTATRKLHRHSPVISQGALNSARSSSHTAFLHQAARRRQSGRPRRQQPAKALREPRLEDGESNSRGSPTFGMGANPRSKGGSIQNTIR